MTDEELRRDDYASMATRARALFEAGTSREEVLRSCYGVEFPDETFVLADMLGENRAPSALYMNRPWSLLIPLERGGPPREPNMLDKAERRVLELDPSLVPLMILREDFHHYGGTMACYQIDELAAGRATVMGLQRDLKDGSVAKRCGDSLAAVLHASAAKAATGLEKEYDDPNNRGAGSLDLKELTGARRDLARVDELVSAVAARRRPRLVP